MSDHCFEEARLKVVSGWLNMRRMESVRSVLIGSELNKSEKEQAYQVSFHERYGRVIHSLFHESEW